MILKELFDFMVKHFSSKGCAKAHRYLFIFHHKKIGQPICKREWRTNHKNDIIATLLENGTSSSALHHIFQRCFNSTFLLIIKGCHIILGKYKNVMGNSTHTRTIFRSLITSKISQDLIRLYH